jgi:hypothetical protein
VQNHFNCRWVLPFIARPLSLCSLLAIEPLSFQFNLAVGTEAFSRLIASKASESTPPKDANSGQGKSVPFLFNRLNRKRGLLLTNYSCKRMRQPLIISQWQRTRPIKKMNKTHERMSHPVRPTLQNCRRTSYNCFTTSGSNHRVFSFVTVSASSISTRN